MKYLLQYFPLLFLLLSLACKNDTPTTVSTSVESMVLGSGDEKSIAIAEKVMLANGGEEAWENTRYIKWNFFGSRRHIWDKQTGDLVIEGLKDKFLIKMNLNSGKGTVNYNDVEYVQPDTLSKYLQLGKEMWINDAYWLLLPFKLRDPGVNLKYLGQAPLRLLPVVDKIELTFDNVGKTPQNKYIIHVDPKSNRIVQWDFYPTRASEQPRFATPWLNYQKYGNIWLSDNRGENYVLSELEVDTENLKNYFK